MSRDNCVAIIGMAGRLPAAPDLETYWQNLRAGAESIRSFTDSELDPAAKSLAELPGFVNAAGVVDDIDQFDAGFFRMPAAEAELIDPQHRMFLECAWHAFEDAGYGDPAAYPGVVSVYAGSWLSSYAMHARGHTQDASDELKVLIANGLDYLPPLVSYKLDLRGESIAVQTACSTSLVAVHMACQSLLTGQSDLALAGGVSIDAHQKQGYVWHEGSTLSPDGHCRPFSSAAQGSPRGYGLGVVLLKRFEDAVADGDSIRALILGSAVNNDGRARIGFSSPGVTGQAQVIATALSMAEADAESIGFVEAHGTGTPLGDAIEVEALRRAFATDKRTYCALGSVKSNLGHLSEAGGIASLMKAVLALEQREIPGTLHFAAPNPEIDFSATPFFVNRELRAWTSTAPRRAGVNSFGVGGTNAHLVLEEAPAPLTTVARDGQPLVFLLSAENDAALEQQKRVFYRWLWLNADVPLADVACTLATGRKAFSQRAAYVATTRSQLFDALEAAGVAPAANREREAQSTPESNGAHPLRAATERWLNGESVEWTSLLSGRRIRMFGYPFQRQHYWLEPQAGGSCHGLAWWLRSTSDQRA